MLQNFILKTLPQIIKQPLSSQNVCCLHLSAALDAWAPKDRDRCAHWKSYNDKIFPPQAQDEPPRHAYICHSKENIKYSYKKMWYVASFIRGMSIDEALKQLKFVNKKGAVAVTDTLLEAQDLAVKEHNVEFKSNLWVSESFVGKGIVVKGARRHARGRMGRINYGFVHYFVTLEEGKPPENYYHFHKPKTSEEMLSEWVENLRKRKVYSSL